MRDGRTKDPLYWVWAVMKRRCYSPNTPDYPRYGGRGITMYEPWIDDPRSCIDWIRENLGDRPEEWTIDRIDNNGPYEPGNLRWATQREQAYNRTHQIGVSGKRGVSPTPSGRWKSSMKYKGKRITMGTFDTVDEAHEAYLAKRIEMGLPI